MAATPLTPNLIEPLMQLITMVGVGLDPTVAASAKAVRIGWQTTGQPASDITEDVIYIRCTEEDDLYNRIRDEEIADVLPEPSTQLQITTTYTRVWRTFWTLYGPGSFDKARQIKSALFKQKIHDMLLGAYGTFQLLPNPGAYANLALYLVTEIMAPTRVPENFGGQWWERVDFACQFNEGVTEVDTVNAVVSTEVFIEETEYIPCS
jgi:hypothetical protein